MKKHIEHKTFIPIPIYNYRIYVVVTNDVSRSLTKWYSKIGQENTDDTGAAFHLYLHGTPECTLILPRRADIGTVVHECWHAVHRMFKWVDIPVENETVAYTLGYVCGEVGRFVLTS